MARTTRILIGLVAVAAIAGLLFVALRSPGRQRPVAVGVSVRPARGGALTASLRSEPGTYNRYVEQSAAAELLSLLTQAPLVRVDPTTDHLEPWLAESWTRSDDGLTYTMHLRHGVTFSDGSPFSSADVLFSFAALYDPRVNAVLAPDTYAGGRPLTVEAPDPATVVLHLAAPAAAGLRLIDGVPMLPKHRLEKALAQGKFRAAWSAATPLQDIAGLGPFVLTEHLPGQRLVFSRNPHYWRHDAAGTALPYLDRLTVEVVSDQNTEALRMQQGQIDLMANGEIRPEDFVAFRRLAAQGALRLIDAGVGLDPNLLWFNLSPAGSADPRNPWLRSRSFRQGLSCAIDRDALANAVYLGAAVPIYSPITPGNTKWYAPVRPACDHDLLKARDLLSAAGLSDRNGDGQLEDAAGVPARFSIVTQQGHTIRQRTASVLQEQLRQIGITVDIAGLDPGALFDRWSRGDYDAIYFGVQSSATDPALNPQFWLSSGNFHFWNPRQPSPSTEWEKQIDDLFTRQARSLDLAERQQLVTEAQTVLVTELPAIYFVAPQVTLVTSTRVANARPAPQIPQLLWSADTLADASAR